MKSLKPTIAAIELLLVLPALLFMSSLFLREVQPLMQTGRVVEWYSHHVVLGLYVFLVAMPVTAFFVGCALVLQSWRGDSQFRQDALRILTTVRTQASAMLIAGATVLAGIILAVVALHMLTE